MKHEDNSPGSPAKVRGPKPTCKPARTDWLRHLAEVPTLLLSGLFDAAYYKARYDDVASSSTPALWHFLLHGAREGRNPNAVFDVNNYHASHPAVQQSGRNPLAHFIRHERRGGPVPQQPAILVIDYRFPTPDQDAGSVRMMAMLDALLHLGFHVTFAADSPGADEPNRRMLERKGMQVLAGKNATRAHMEHHGGCYQAVITPRPLPSVHYLIPIKYHMPQAFWIYDTVDLHWIRRLRQADVEDNAAVRIHAHDEFRAEQLLMAHADCILAVTEEEREIILKHHPAASIHLLPCVHRVEPLPKPFAERRGLMFIGGFDHPPNGDAMRWFVRDIAPRIHAVHPDIPVQIVGSNPTPDILALQSDRITVAGFVPDVEPSFNDARVFIAPLRAGAGMKGKIGQAMSCGLPVVTTSNGAEGMRLCHEENALIADTPQAFAEQVLRLYQDQALWEKLRRNALEHMQSHFSPRRAEQTLAEILHPKGGDR